MQPQIPNVVDDAVIDVFSRGHDGREDGSLTLGIGVAPQYPSNSCRKLAIRVRTSLNVLEWVTK